MTMRVIDVHGFAGGFSCGATLAGFTLVGKRESRANFGTALLEANRAFLGDQWEAQASDPEDWFPVPAEGIIATPPCSAFSSMTAGNKKMHGMDSEINNCMRDVMNFAVKVKPKFVAMESVAQAYTKGLPLMRELATTMREGTGINYHVTHVVQNNWSVGGCSKRKRYFLVLTEFPFGVERFDLKWLPTLGDALTDLQNMPLTWDDQVIPNPPTWWSGHLRTPDNVVDGHIPPVNAYGKRVADLSGPQAEHGVDWKSGESEAAVLKRYYETHGKLPDSWYYATAKGTTTRADQLIARNFDAGGFSKPRHWPWDQPARVVNGAGSYMIWHPEGRFATHREVARIMGFPDSWKIKGANHRNDLHSYWGKGTSVAPARWLMDWMRESMNGNPGSVVGEPVGDWGDTVIDVSNDWKNAQVPATATAG